MKKRRLVATENLLDGVVCFLGFTDGVAYDDRAPSVAQLKLKQLGDLLGGLHPSRDDPLSRLRLALNLVDAYATRRHRRDHGVPNHVIRQPCGVGRGTATASIGLKECPSARGRQGGREQDDRDPVHAEPHERGFQVGLHVLVGCVHLVDDDDLSHEAEVAHQHVAGSEGGQQHLVDRAHHDGRQGRTPSLPHPSARMQARVPLIVVHFEGAGAFVE